MFERHLYYSKTEVLKKYKVSSKRYDVLIASLNVVRKEADLGGYRVTTCYVLREEVERLNLNLRMHDSK